MSKSLVGHLLRADRKETDPLVTKIEERNHKDMVNHPSHYQSNDMETIDVIEAFELNFSEGSAVKYILRAGKKGDIVEDWEKAIWYLERLIENAKN